MPALSYHDDDDDDDENDDVDEGGKNVGGEDLSLKN